MHVTVLGTQCLMLDTVSDHVVTWSAFTIWSGREGGGGGGGGGGEQVKLCIPSSYIHICVHLRLKVLDSVLGVLLMARGFLCKHTYSYNP